MCVHGFDPVCGCDQVTYSNECKAKAKGMSIAHGGPCTIDGPSSSSADDQGSQTAIVIGTIVAVAIGAIVALWVSLALARATGTVPSWVPAWIIQRSPPIPLSSYFRLSSPSPSTTTATTSTTPSSIYTADMAGIELDRLDLNPSAHITDADANADIDIGLDLDF